MNVSILLRLICFKSCLLLASACTGSNVPNLDSKPLTDFQWAVSTDAMLVLVPVGEKNLYPAVREGAVLESLPLKVRVRIEALQETRTVRVDRLVSPQQISSRQWRLQTQSPDGWQTQNSYEFDGAMFYVEDLSERVPFTSVRFVRN